MSRHTTRKVQLLLIATATAVSLGASLRPAAAQASRCTPARAMIVLDKSSSMNNLIGSQKMWTIAKASLDTIATSYQTKIELGLMIFPSPNQCSPGSVFVPPALSTRDAIMQALGTGDPPASGNYTPMAQSIKAAGDDAAMTDTTRQRHLILITDGWQWCSPYDPATRFTPVEEVTKLAARGVSTFVVGFGGATDALALNRMAVAGGTALPGCDPTGSMPTAANKCYYQADSPAQLLMALTSISTTVSAETCDGLDNDCDGLVDEGVTRSCQTACGMGVEQCVSGVFQGCDAPAVTAEICDDMDNDCDGTVDPGCDCVMGDQRACGSAVGECSAGEQTCGADGKWGACMGQQGEAAEICDGLDNDCDGRVDDADPASPLCMPMYQCAGAAGCTMLEPVTPVDPGDPDASGLESGCGCKAGGRQRGSAGLIAMALLLTAIVLARFARSRR